METCLDFSFIKSTQKIGQEVDLATHTNTSCQDGRGMKSKRLIKSKMDFQDTHKIFARWDKKNSGQETLSIIYYVTH